MITESLHKRGRGEPIRAIRLAFLAAVLLAAGCSKPPSVSVVQPENHRLEVTFTERAETILRQEYPVTMPVAGKVGRIELEVGDRVRKGELLAAIDTLPAEQELQARNAGVEASVARKGVTSDTSVEQAELQRSVKSAQALQNQMSAIGPAKDAARVALDNARIELRRVRNLVATGALPARDAEAAQLAVEEAQASLAAKASEEQVLRSQLAEAQAVIASMRARIAVKTEEAASQQPLVEEARARREQAEYTLEKSRLVSPVDGLVLARHERGPVDLPAGAPLLTLGRLQDIEAVCDVLSQDALRLNRGTQVTLDAGDAYSQPLKGEVRLVEPQGFTKRSSLGVEQQRVKVRISILTPPETLGTGYELWARFLLTTKTALSLPRSCFVRYGDDFRVWRVKDNKLELVAVEVGLRGDHYWEVTGSSVTEGDRIVRSPDESLQEGLEVVVEGTAAS